MRGKRLVFSAGEQQSPNRSSASTLSCNPATPTPLPATRVAISHVTSILQAANTSAVSPPRPALQFGTGGALRERLDIPARDRLDANYGMDSSWVNLGVNTNQHDLLVPPLGAFIGLAPQVLSCPCFYAVSDSLLLGDIGQSLASGEHAIFPCALCGAPASTSRERGPSSTPPALHRCRSTVRAPRAWIPPLGSSAPIRLQARQAYRWRPPPAFHVPTFVDHDIRLKA
ncbi:hypothetical protein B0H16DRAFT_585740 [Mycena metata]|uniref:Uncharacterized protein n=1 Tax=Mycena metata TaxID=1033252 RepID=A0AAD7J921_9AGAR|nr:hypothetical protein B0H16DRAFT_585740 [Mycena metata]